MKIIIKATNLELTPKLKKAIEEKIGSLDKFISHTDPAVVQASVEVAFEKGYEDKEKVYYAEANVKLPGKVIRSEARENNIYKAINEVKDELQRSFRKYKRT